MQENVKEKKLFRIEKILDLMLKQTFFEKLDTTKEKLKNLRVFC